MAALCNRVGHYIFALWFYLQTTPRLPFLRERSADGATTSAEEISRKLS